MLLVAILPVLPVLLDRIGLKGTQLSLVLPGERFQLSAASPSMRAQVVALDWVFAGITQRSFVGRGDPRGDPRWLSSRSKLEYEKLDDSRAAANTCNSRACDSLQSSAMERPARSHANSSIGLDLLDSNAIELYLPP